MALLFRVFFPYISKRRLLVKNLFMLYTEIGVFSTPQIRRSFVGKLRIFFIVLASERTSMTAYSAYIRNVSLDIHATCISYNASSYFKQLFLCLLHEGT